MVEEERTGREASSPERSPGRRWRLLVGINALDIGGAERQLLDQICSGARYWECRIACLERRGDLAEEAETEGVPIQVLGSDSRWDLRTIGRLRRLVREWRPDIVHLHLPRAGIIGRLACRSEDAPVAYTEHNVLSMYPRSIRWLNERTYHLQDVAIACSEAVADSIVANVAAKRLRRPPVVIRNGVDVRRLEKTALTREEARRKLGLPPRAFAIGNVATLHPRKGQEYLLQAAAKLASDHSDCHFAVIGEGELEESLLELRDRLGLRDRFTIHTGISNAAPYMTAFDLFVLPSIYEGLPIALLEAMALGIPSVAAKVGGIPEVIRSESEGLVVEPRDVQGLAQAALRLIRKPELRDQMSRTGRMRVIESFSVDSLVERHRQVYKELLAARIRRTKDEG